MIPPKPPARSDKVSLWRYMKLFRQDILSAQPDRLYTAKMAALRTPFFRSFMINEPALIDDVLKARPMEFPKSDRISEGLRPLLGQSVFLTNGATWMRQRRIIDPAFERGRVKVIYPLMVEAGRGALTRIGTGGQAVDIEYLASHMAADVIFRTLFSIPIEDALARRVFDAFQAHQKAQPLLNLGAFLKLPTWLPRLHRRQTRKTAKLIRDLISALCATRAREIAEGSAPPDLATKIMTTEDPETGARFSTDEMVDQVAIFFLAGHETSASALSWALYLLAAFPTWQDKLASDVADFEADRFSELQKLPLARDVFREALRLYPPVPMMVREAASHERFRDRAVRPGDQIVISPWHLHRNGRLWDNPDGFDPARWQSEAGKPCMRDAFLPFSSGARVCPGAGFAMIEGPLLLAMLVKAFRFETIDGDHPVPVAHLTVRSARGIRLRVTPRSVSQRLE